MTENDIKKNMNRLNNLHSGLVKGAESDVKSVLKELMDNYDLYKESWLTAYGNTDNYDTWFTGEVMGTNS
jgi:hypothetical protein